MYPYNNLCLPATNANENSPFLTGESTIHIANGSDRHVKAWSDVPQKVSNNVLFAVLLGSALKKNRYCFKGKFCCHVVVFIQRTLHQPWLMPTDTAGVKQPGVMKLI